eukprot:CAMPEP_0194367044 /NCGR_PEP_ID=MMETSP0174-20130528/15156_1 /TAXON_ID=216777 /ORGANISM="Proboscia alata, Strain PI-D3" /LENGTH=655 /DNA_ID=CAMNT_0039142607 /DNA_START=48 /DNA_END=2015 /DNA_ORIENTATION=-
MTAKTSLEYSCCTSSNPTMNNIESEASSSFESILEQQHISLTTKNATHSASYRKRIRAVTLSTGACFLISLCTFPQLSAVYGFLPGEKQLQCQGQFRPAATEIDASGNNFSSTSRLRTVFSGRVDLMVISHSHASQLSTNKRSALSSHKGRIINKYNSASHATKKRNFFSSALFATVEEDKETREAPTIGESESWSGASTRRESPLGVRRRVKRVLEKARNRTGIRNSSLKETGRTRKRENAASVVADAASIGGLGAVIVDENGTVDVALDFVPIEEDGIIINDDAGEIVLNINGSKNGTIETNGDILNSAINGNVKVEGKINQERLSSPGNTTYSSSNIGSATSKKTRMNAEKKTNPASTWSPPVTPLPKMNPEDRLVPATKKKSVNKYSEIDAFNGDVSAAFSVPASPLPFTLPKLTSDQKQVLLKGERVQYQVDMKREGSGFVAVDVNASPNVVWDCLLDFYSYPDIIPTVRDVKMFTNTHLKSDYRSEKPLAYEDGSIATLKHGVPSVTRAAFTLSKFRLNIAAIHKYRPHPQGDYMIFTLDPACTNPVLKAAKGVWHTQPDIDGRKGVTRVWLLCDLKVSSLLPRFIVDYAAKKAMPRASSWLKPQVEAAASLWLKETNGATPSSINGESPNAKSLNGQLPNGSSTSTKQ